MNPHYGRWFEETIDWLLQNVGWLFDGVAAVVGGVVDSVLALLVMAHPILIILILASIAALVSRSAGLTVFSVLAFGLIYVSELWVPTMESLSIVLVSVLIALLIGIPVGIWASQNRAVSMTVRPILDLMQAMPVFVYLIPAVFFYGIGQVPGIMATIIFALPPAVRLTELGIRQLDHELVEAAMAFGAKRGLLLREVQLPLAFPSIMAGVNQVIMLALSMVVVAGMVGAGGLGGVVFQGVSQLDAAKGFEGGMAVVILAIYLDRVTGGASRIAEYLRDRRRKRSERAGLAVLTTSTPSR